MKARSRHQITEVIKCHLLHYYLSNALFVETHNEYFRDTPLYSPHEGYQDAINNIRRTGSLSGRITSLLTTDAECMKWHLDAMNRVLISISSHRNETIPANTPLENMGLRRALNIIDRYETRVRNHEAALKRRVAADEARAKASRSVKVDKSAKVDGDNSGKTNVLSAPRGILEKQFKVVISKDKLFKYSSEYKVTHAEHEAFYKRLYAYYEGYQPERDLIPAPVTEWYTAGTLLSATEPHGVIGEYNDKNWQYKANRYVCHDKDMWDVFCTARERYDAHRKAGGKTPRSFKFERTVLRAAIDKGMRQPVAHSDQDMQPSNEGRVTIDDAPMDKFTDEYVEYPPSKLFPADNPHRIANVLDEDLGKTVVRVVVRRKEDGSWCFAINFNNQEYEDHGVCNYKDKQALRVAYTNEIRYMADRKKNTYITDFIIQMPEGHRLVGDVPFKYVTAVAWPDDTTPMHERLRVRLATEADTKHNARHEDEKPQSEIQINRGVDTPTHTPTPPSPVPTTTEPMPEPMIDNNPFNPFNPSNPFNPFTALVDAARAEEAAQAPQPALQPTHNMVPFPYNMLPEQYQVCAIGNVLKEHEHLGFMRVFILNDGKPFNWLVNVYNQYVYHEGLLPERFDASRLNDKVGLARVAEVVAHLKLQHTGIMLQLPEGVVLEREGFDLTPQYNCAQAWPNPDQDGVWRCSTETWPVNM